MQHVRGRSCWMGFLAGAMLAAQTGLTAAAQDAGTLTAELRKGLDREVSGLFYPALVDEQNGGFHQNLARDGSLAPDSDPFLVFQARMTWTAAQYALFDPAHREEYARYARHGLAYLDTVMRDAEHGGFHWIVNRQGKPEAGLGTDKHVYGTAFVVYAASKVYEATADAAALRVARDAFDWLEQHAHDAEWGGYFEALSREGQPRAAGSRGPDGRLLTDRVGIPFGYKTMNSHIHLLEAFAALARHDERPIVRERLGEVHALVRDRIASEPGALNLYLTRDWKPVPAHDSFGHDVETAYLLVEAAETLGIPEDAETWRVARRLVDHALEFGWDGEHGGFYDKGDAIGGSAYDTTKIWWTQAEGLNALLLMHQKFGAETDRYARAFQAQWRFIRDHQLDPEFGGWFGEVKREGKLLGDGAKATPWKACYHSGRALMNAIHMLADPKTRPLPGG